LSVTRKKQEGSSEADDWLWIILLREKA